MALDGAQDRPAVRGNRPLNTLHTRRAGLPDSPRDRPPAAAPVGGSARSPTPIDTRDGDRTSSRPANAGVRRRGRPPCRRAHGDRRTGSPGGSRRVACRRRRPAGRRSRKHWRLSTCGSRRADDYNATRRRSIAPARCLNLPRLQGGRPRRRHIGAGPSLRPSWRWPPPRGCSSDTANAMRNARVDRLRAEPHRRR